MRYHYCDEGYGIGYDIVVKKCNIDKNFSAATDTKDAFYYIENWDRYQVHVVYKGFRSTFLTTCTPTSGTRASSSSGGGTEP